MKGIEEKSKKHRNDLDKIKMLKTIMDKIRAKSKLTGNTYKKRFIRTKMGESEYATRSPSINQLDNQRNGNSISPS